MSVEYPWLVANGRLPTLFDKIVTAARPEKFTQEFLEKLGLSSSNDRALIPLLRKLGFLTESNTPTSAYDLLRDPKQRPFVLAEKMRDLYSDLFSINTNIAKAPDSDVRSAIARVTGKDEITVGRYFSTFKALANQANFDAPSMVAQEAPREKPAQPIEIQELVPSGASVSKAVAFHYNIQIVLPATSDIGVYNAIFKSLRENLDV